MMKKRPLVIVVAVIVIICVILFVKFNIKRELKINLSDEMQEKIKAVELSDALTEAIVNSAPSNFRKAVFNVKTAVLEMQPNEADESIIAQLIADYGVQNTLVGYSYLYYELGTWDDLKSILSKNNKGAGWKDIFEDYGKKRPKYTQRTFPVERMEEWISDKNYRAEDIATIDRISQLYEVDFDELLSKYERNRSISDIKSDLGIVNTKKDIESVSIDESDVEAFSELYNIGKTEAAELMRIAILLGYDVTDVLQTNCKNTDELISIMLKNKYDER